MLTNTQVAPAAIEAALDQLRADARARFVEVLADRHAHGHDAPVEREPAGGVLTLGGRDDRRMRPQRREPARGGAAAGDGDDRLRRAAIGEGDRGLAQRPRVILVNGRPLDRGHAVQRRGLGVADDRVEGLDRAHGVGAGRGLAREHDHVDPVFDRVGGVVDLGAGRARLGHHRLEHLRRHDHRLAGLARPPGDFLLRAGNALERHLETEVAARDHHRVAGVEDLLEVLERQRPLQLRDQRHAGRAGVVHDPPRLLHVGGRLHEAERHHVDAEREAELEILDVLRRHRRGRQRHSRRIDPFVLADFSAFDDGRLNLLAVGRVDAQLDASVGQQQPVVGTHALRETFERGEQPSGSADAVAGGDGDRLARREHDRLAAGESTGADLRAAKILENRDLAAGAAGRGPDSRERRRLRLVSTVREVQAEDVGAGGDERVEGRLGVAGRPDGGDDLRVAHLVLE